MRILETLAHGPATLYDLAEMLDAAAGRIRYSLDALHLERRVHVMAYRENVYASGTHRTVPVYAAGPGQDAPAPRGKAASATAMDFLRGIEVQDVYMHWLRTREPQ